MPPAVPALRTMSVWDGRLRLRMCEVVFAGLASHIVTTRTRVRWSCCHALAKAGKLGKKSPRTREDHEVPRQQLLARLELLIKSNHATQPVSNEWLAARVGCERAHERNCMQEENLAMTADPVERETTISFLQESRFQ